MLKVENNNSICTCLSCGKIAVYKIDFEKIFFRKINLCKECFSQLYKEIGKVLIPKSIENVTKKIKVKE